MANSIFKSGLRVSEITTGCTFSLLFIKSKFPEAEKVYMIHYTEENKVYTIITDGEKWLKSPVTIRVSLGQEISNLSKFLNVIEDAFLSTQAIVFDKDDYQNAGLIR